MEITKKTLLKIYENSIDGTQYLLLQLIGTQIDIKELFENVKLKGSLLLLQKKDLIENISDSVFQLTEKGKKIFEDIGVIKHNKINIDDNSKITLIYQNIENTIFNITGKKQILNPSGKYLKPPLNIFKLRLKQFLNKFSISDIDRVEKALLLYTKKVCKKQITYPVALIYFIWNEKRGTIESELLQWMEQENETEEYDGTNI